MTSSYHEDWFTGRYETARTTATIAGHEVEFTALHREENDTPVTTAVTVTMPMSLEDLASALWIVVNGGMTFEELTDDQVCRELVLETVFAEGGLKLSDARIAMEETRPRTADHHIARQVKARVAKVFGPTAVPTPRARSRGRRELAGASR